MSTSTSVGISMSVSMPRGDGGAMQPIQAGVERLNTMRAWQPTIDDAATTWGRQSTNIKRTSAPEFDRAGGLLPPRKMATLTEAADGAPEQTEQIKNSSQRERQSSSFAALRQHPRDVQGAPGQVQGTSRVQGGIATLDKGEQAVGWAPKVRQVSDAGINRQWTNHNFCFITLQPRCCLVSFIFVFLYIHHSSGGGFWLADDWAAVSTLSLHSLPARSLRLIFSTFCFGARPILPTLACFLPNVTALSFTVSLTILFTAPSTRRLPLTALSAACVVSTWSAFLVRLSPTA
jgi:hypothetical protein